MTKTTTVVLEEIQLPIGDDNFLLSSQVDVSDSEYMGIILEIKTKSVNYDYEESEFPDLKQEQGYINIQVFPYVGTTLQDESICHYDIYCHQEQDDDIFIHQYVNLPIMTLTNLKIRLINKNLKGKNDEKLFQLVKVTVILSQ